MNFIPCASDCFYQHDGYCRLNRSAAVTNSKNVGCPHFLNRANGSSSLINLPSAGFIEPFLQDNPPLP